MLSVEKKPEVVSTAGAIHGGGGIRPAVFDTKDFSQRMILKGLASATDDGLGS